MVSDPGRTKTLPTGDVSQVRLAVFSCANITADPFDAYLKAARIGDDDAVGAVINAKDGLILGRSSVFLEGRRSAVRQQESNFGNLSADANLWYAQQYDPSVRISLKNGGGIRNAIGSTSPTGELLPTRANPTAGKQAGDISRLDIEDSLKFNNALSLLSLNAAQLKLLLEHGVAASNGSGPDRATPGQFCQLGGLVVVVDLAQAAQRYTSVSNVITGITHGRRIRYAALLDASQQPSDVLIADGDGVSNAEETALFTLGLNPDRTNTPSQANALLRLRRAGQSEVTSAPAQFNLFTADDITSARLLGRNDVVTNPVPFGLFASPRADFRLDGLILPLSSNAVVTLRLQSSDDMETWSDTAVVPNVEVNLTAPLKFFRFQAN